MLWSQYSIIQDIRSGSPSSDPSGFAIFNSELYFAANEGTNGNELWKYDGTNPPSMVADIATGSSSSSPSNLVVFNSKLYFTATNGTNGTELWEYDGTNSPSMVADIAPGAGNGVRYQPVVFDGKLYFEGLDFSNFFALWQYDGTNAPSMVVDIHSGIGSGISDLTVFDGKLFFAADDETLGFELYSYDGSSASLIQDINTSGGSTPGDLYVFNNKLHFDATDGSNGFELWEYDGSNAPTMIANINSGSGDASPKNLMEFNGKLYFNATDGSNGFELWEYDGSNAPTMVADINSGGANSTPDNLIVYNDQLYFSADDGSTGIELWTYDGTNTPTLVDDLYMGALNGAPDDMIIYDGKLMMEASDGSTGFEFWSYTAPSSCSCSSSSPIPTTAGTYESSCSTTDGVWRHYCDDDGNLILSLNIGASGAVVNDDEVSLKIQSPTTTFYPLDCGSTPACFIDLADGAIAFHRNWDVNPTTQPSTGNVGVRHYFTQSEYDAVNTAIDNQGQTELVGMHQLWFYKVTENSLGQFPTISDITSNDVQILSNHVSVPTTDQWVLSTKSAGSEFIAEFEVTSFSGGGGGGSNAGALPLPVELLYFDVSLVDQEVELKWATALEINNDRFELYKSADGIDWELFETIESIGNSPITQSYRSVDKDPYWGNNYYKLVQIDFNGSIESLGVKFLDNSHGRPDHLKIFPNPVKNTINVIDGKGTAFIYDYSGTLLLQSTLETDQSTIDVSSLHSGVFQLVIIPERGSQIVKRFVK